MTEELFQKFIDGLCGIREREEVEDWLNNCSDTELDPLLKERWDNADRQMPVELSVKLWSEVKKDIIASQAPVYYLPVTSNRKRWLAAASIIFLLVSSYFFFGLKSKRPGDETASVSATTGNQNSPRWTVIRNEEAAPEKVMLPDNSQVELYSNAIIRLPADFNRTERAVYLTGKAMFSVAKDKTRPFTVFSNDIATRAVGTKFLVSNDTNSNHIDIRLLEGVIEVRSIKNNFAAVRTLHAGEEIHFGYPATPGNTISHPAAGYVKNNEKVLPGSSADKEDDINFMDTPLDQVFTRMEQLYHVKIEYNKDELANKTLTSSVSKNDNAESLLKMIGRMHDLSIGKTDSSFTVKGNPEK